MAYPSVTLVMRNNGDGTSSSFSRGSLVVPGSLAVGDPTSSSAPLTWSYQDSGQTGFEIQRSVDGAAWATVGIASPSDRGFLAGTLSPSTQYYFRIRAIDVAGGRQSSWTPTVTATTSEAEEWQLSPENYVSAKIPLKIIHPRPDGELTAYARTKYAYPGSLFEIPIGVLGGAYPYHFEIIHHGGSASNTASAVVGATLVNSNDELIADDGYGTLVWTPDGADDGESYSFTVRVTDQDGSFADVDISGTVDSSQFIFVAADAAGGGSGAKESPFTFAEAFGATSAPTNGGKFCYFRGGTHAVTGHSDTANGHNLLIDGAGTKPAVWLAYDFETAVLDFSSAGAVTVRSVPDLYVSRLVIQNNSENSAGRFFMIINAGGHRGVFWRNTWRNHKNHSNSSDNPGCIYWSGVDRNHFLVSGNVLTGQIAHFCEVYRPVEAVFEGNRAVDMTATGSASSNNGLIYLKQSPNFVSVRGNDFTDIEWVSGTSCCLGLGTSQGSRNVEVCYNKFYHPVFNTGGNGDSAMRSGDGGDIPRESHWYYRNNFRGRWLDGVGGAYIDPTVVERNVMEGWPLPPQNEAYEYSGNLDNQSGALSASASLIGAVRAEWLGRRGAEISNG